MPSLKIIQPSEVLSPADGIDPALNQYKYRFLSQGDSWFSIGTFKPSKNSNLVEKLNFSKACCAVNCARPGATLTHMVDNMREPNFVNLLCGPKREPWHGILLSAGGNDMIDALGDKDINDPAERLFLRPSEIKGDLTKCESYLSPAGWATFVNHLHLVFADLVKMRDSTTLNENIPIFLHTYHFPTIRNSGELFGFGPWLYKAVKSFDIPEAIWPTLGRKLFNQFGDLLRDIALLHDNINVFDSANLVPLNPAQPRTAGQSGDWINEIHLTKAGYEKVSMEWSKDIQDSLP